ncbi:hypothetical protein L1987_45375 [Smallanthus sonchifolius]|uniref:Uncharacterized protein n=1 Tax=Smallanthus sonchifolius TaxID=185202 RepID=A0ACB9GRW7_9ASTR|nr:hypothetical protein L1987_45375 [Smallanthus sonchifolius]
MKKSRGNVTVPDIVCRESSKVFQTHKERKGKERKGKDCKLGDSVTKMGPRMASQQQHDSSVDWAANAAIN